MPDLKYCAICIALPRKKAAVDVHVKNKIKAKYHEKLNDRLNSHGGLVNIKDVRHIIEQALEILCR